MSRFRFVAVFQIGKTNLLNRSVVSFSVSDVDSNFSLRFEDSEAKGENDEWWVVLQARGGALPYMGHIGMCRCEGYGFQAV